ncbi:hypothetical protein DFH05DRAFT_1518364 [Lentinula detonsa]|uniref:Uncharacterized protein n=1 Tax=Lentinula detonsa TaxID=2804962 RepID=A0A9W8U2U4_9AGAR|nr:hypothetical protein DFH05DRAFT_1518364 [Lentinula detonsa]
MVKSEIDDIFASKGKIQPSPVTVTSNSSTAKSTKKDKKRKRKERDDKDSTAVEKPKKVPETIIDPSASMPSAKRVKSSKSSENAGDGKETKSGKAKKEGEKFKDSRGTGPRRKTEEGWSIYKADELGLKDDDEGGGKLWQDGIFIETQHHLF